MLKFPNPFQESERQITVAPELRDIFLLRDSVIAQVTRLMTVSPAAGPYYAEPTGLRRCATLQHRGAMYRFEEFHEGASILRPHPASGRISVSVRERDALRTSVELGHRFGQPDVCITDQTPIHLFPSKQIAPVKVQIDLVRTTLQTLLLELQAIERGRELSRTQRFFLGLQGVVAQFN